VGHGYRLDQDGSALRLTAILSFGCSTTGVMVCSCLFREANDDRRLRNRKAEDGRRFPLIKEASTAPQVSAKTSRAGLIDKSSGEPRRLARPIFQTTDRRLRGQWRSALRTAPDRDLHQRVMPQQVEVDGILVAASDRTDARHHHFEHRVPDAARIAAIRLVELVRDGLAMAERWSTAGEQPIEVVWLTITDAGRRALAG
jgi:hypothetical protein